jgi:uncharacterized protein with beta-barrel porin domain
MSIYPSVRATRAQLASFALGSSVFAVAMGIASPAAAQCSPDPTTNFGTTNCVGTDSDGLNVTTIDTNVVVAAGAQVTPGANPAAIVNGGRGDVYMVNGTVAGGSRPGFIVTNGVPFWGPCDPYAGASPRPCSTPDVLYFPGGSATINVAQGGSVIGNTAILLQRRGDNDSGRGEALVNNAGLLIGTAGAALVAEAGTRFTVIQNQATGTIGGIRGAFDNILNAGVIEGIRDGITTTGQALVSNSGRILSVSTMATIQGGTVSVTNSGTILNAIRAAAIMSAGVLSIDNQAGGTIGSEGIVAIRSGAQINLTNAGTISGSIIAGDGQYSGSMIDNVAGTIKGGVTLGGSNDVLKARFDSAAGRIAGISGTIDGGAGMDQLQLSINANATLGQDAIPASFEQLALQISNNAAATLATANATANGITVTGSGRLINTATLVTTGSAITTTWSGYDKVIDVENSGSITATPTYPGLAAVQTSQGSFTNSGMVASIGGVGVNVEGRNVTSLTNSGTISATSTGAALRYAKLINSGSIQSTSGIGVSLFRDDGTGASTNSGSISGATIGVSAYSVQLVNSGSISGGTTAIVADALRLDNMAGGIITSGGNLAVDGRNNSGTGSTIRNAGTIIGNVDLARSGGYDYTPDVFIDAGGTLNGGLRMGGGDDLLVVSLGGDANRPLAGATGGVDMGDGMDTVRFVAGTSQSAALAVPTGFEDVAYEVRNGATLTLTAANARTAPLGLGLAGSGTIDLSADVAISDTPAIRLGEATVDELLAGGRPWGTEYTANPGLTVISRGHISATNNSTGSCAIFAAGAAFENAGTITTASGPGAWSSPVAVCYGGTVTNSGTIRTDGGYGIIGSGTFVNRGTLTDIAGSDGSGVINVATVVNSGTIVTDQAAIESGMSGVDITNSGTLESRVGTAVGLGLDGRLTNEASGTIRASETAIWGVRGEVINRGRIIGDVDLGGVVQSPSPFAATTAITTAAVAAVPGGRYVADGGTLDGDLRFGAGDDVLVQNGATTGVTGSIDGGTGFDRVILSTTTRGRFDGATNFELLDVAAGEWTLGAPTTMAETAIASGATLIGTTTTLDGTITNAGILRIEQNFDGAFGGTLEGDGALVKAGTGTVTLGDQLGFSGTTSILGGRLVLSGRTAARLTVVGGTFGGSGTIGSLSLGNGGTVSPGDNAIGMLTVSGNFAQTAGSTYIANLTAAGLSDQILIGGTASLGQGARLVLGGSVGGMGTRYTLLTAAGGLSGVYDLVEQPNGDYQLRLVYSANSVFADVTRSAAGLANLSASANQRATALGLSGLPVVNRAYAAITLEADENGARAALDQLSGEAHASLGAVMVQDARIVEDAVLTRTLTREVGAGLWGSMVGKRGTEDGNGGTATLRHSTWGGVGGVDLALDGGRIGVAGGYTRTDFAVSDRRSDGQVQTIHVLGYASGEIGPITLRTGIGYAWTDNRVNRNIGFADVSESLRADYDGNMLYSFLEAGHAFAMGGGSIQPVLGFQSYRVKTDAFAETGGSAALRGAKRTDSLTFAKLGLRAETPIVEGLSARANVAWLRRVDGDAPSLNLGFAGATSGFEVNGVSLSRDAASAGIDLVWSPSANVRIVSGYNGRIGSRGDDSSFRVAASIGF